MKQENIRWPIAVKTRRLVLRPYKLNDYDIWIAAYTGRKPKQHKYDGGPHHAKETSKKWFRKLVAKHTRLAKKDDCYVFGIFEKSTGKHLGTIDISTISRDWYQWCNLGYVVHNTAQRRGIGKEAARAGLKIAFNHLAYKRVEAAINVDNWRSIRLAKSLGMKREGLRKEYIYDNNQWEDHVVYTALNPRKKKRSYKMMYRR